MKIIFTFLLLCFCCHAQTPSYFHDTALDSINGGVGNVDADVNRVHTDLSQINTNVQNLLTLNQLKTNAASDYTNFSGSGMVAVTSNTYNLSGQITNAWASVLGTNNLLNNWFSFPNATNVTSPSLSVINLGTFAGGTYTMDFSINSLKFIASLQVSFKNTWRLNVLL